MAKTILATTPLSYNEINSLAQLFACAFLRLNEPGIPSEHVQQKRHFFQQVHTVVGMAFTATLVEQDLLALFKPHLHHFLQHQVNDGNRYASVNAGIAMGDIISLGSDAFRTLEHPEYYSYFLNALRESLHYITTTINIPKSFHLNKIMALVEADE